ncbi:MAG: hypothetical protein WCO62_06095, partial [Betaproteobacteria bacterium]
MLDDTHYLQISTVPTVIFDIEGEVSSTTGTSYFIQLHGASPTAGMKPLYSRLAVPSSYSTGINGFSFVYRPEGLDTSTMTNPVGAVTTAGANPLPLWLAISITDADAVVLGNVTATGAVALIAVGAITQSGNITGTTLSVTTTNANATLTGASNTFSGAITANVGTGMLTLKNTNATATNLGNVTAGNFTLTSTGNVTQSGNLTVSGLTDVTASGMDITLTAT